jgi:hypothetical protein
MTRSQYSIAFNISVGVIAHEASIVGHEDLVSN